MAQEGNDPLVGKVLSGRFQILSPIGAGGMGRVYKAVQQPLDRIVALKVLNPKYEGSKDPGFERRFFLEASMTSKLKHPNTITVHDYGRTDDGVFFIAMEFLEGETLGQRLQEEQRLIWPRAVSIAAQIARSLREAHKLGMVHRDLKPANIMLLSEATGGDVVKVLDFGLVKSFMPDGSPAVPEPDITQAGVLLGSPLYMAPEQAKSLADARTDIYALGVVLFQCMAGRPPFVGKESIEIIVKHIRERPPSLRSLAPEVPQEVSDLVARCLEKNPDARYQTMDELLDALKAAGAGQGVSAVFADPRGAPAPTASSGLRAATPRRVTQELIESSDVTQTGAPRKRVVAIALVIALALGGVVAVIVKRSISQTDSAPVVVVPPKPPPPTTPAAPAKILFLVESEPAGASVTLDGAALGVTPLRFERSKPPEGPARGELMFSLEGYSAESIVVQGTEGTVPVKMVLTKSEPHPVAEPPPLPKPPKPKLQPKPDHPAGYKEDPYQ